MFKLYPIIFFILFTTDLFAGNARQIAMGNIGSTSTGAGAMYSNPSGLVWDSHHILGSTYARHHFISELDRQFLNYSIARNNKAYAFLYNQMGDKRLLYRSFSLSYAQLFSDKFSLALRLGLSHVQFSDNYGNKTIFRADIGMLTKINEKLNLGFYIINAGRSILVSEYKERFENGILTGISYKSSELFKLELELEKYALQKVNFKLGLEYQVSNSFFLRGGFQSGLRRFSSGFGYMRKRFAIDSAIYYSHPVGYSVVLSLSLSLEKQN